MVMITRSKDHNADDINKERIGGRETERTTSIYTSWQPTEDGLQGF